MHIVKPYLERFAYISDPEKWTTNVDQRKKHARETCFQITQTLLRQLRHKTRFPKRVRVANLELRNFHYQNVT